jgi:conjugative transfer region lipoprotein (TIGR03751 family)
MRWTAVLLFTGALTLASLQGCSVSGPRASPLPKSGPKMIDIYERHVAETGARAAAVQATPRLRRYDDAGRASDAGDAGGAGDSRFARLPNPDLVMYVYPHLAKGRYPVPGYATVFPMFESVQYALPGEMPPPAATELLPVTR